MSSYAGDPDHSKQARDVVLGVLLVHEDRDDFAQLVVDELVLVPLATKLDMVAGCQRRDSGCREVPTLLDEVVGSLDLFVPNDRLLVS